MAAERPTTGFFTEVVGSEALTGKRARAGILLQKADGLAGRVAAKYAQSKVATVVFDSVHITAPVLHGDFVRLDARIVRVGSSSMVVEVRAHKLDLATRRFVPVQHCMVTMVSLDDDLRPRKGLPKLPVENVVAIGAYVEERREAEKELARLVAALREKSENGDLSIADVVGEEGEGCEPEYVIERLPMADATVFFRTSFLPSSVNTNATIFGGLLLEFEADSARTAAKAFSRNPHVYITDMSRMTFTVPVFVGDAIEAKATPVYVRKHEVVISVSVTVERINGDIAHSHEGTFTVATLDPSGFRARIPVLLDLDAASESERLAYAEARTTYHFWHDSNPHLLVPPDYNDPWPAFHVSNLPH